MQKGEVMGATIRDIARETGLGLATISSYLNGGNVREKNRIKIEAAIEALHFEVNETARGLKTNKTKTIGIVIPELNNVFCAEIISEAEDILRQNGYAAMLCDCRSDVHREAEAIEFLLHKRVDGLLIMPTGEHSEKLTAFSTQKRPVVLIDRKVRGVEYDSVLADNEGAAKEAVKRLAEAGHTKIGLIAGPQEIYTASARNWGFQKAMMEAGLKLTDSMMVCGDYTIKGGARAMKQLHETHPDMTAVLISNYEMTVGAMIEINETGIRVPEELSIIGFDNLEFAKAISPSLSIMTQPTRQMATAAVELLLKRLDGDTDTPVQTVILPTEYVKGRSIKTIGAGCTDGKQGGTAHTMGGTT